MELTLINSPFILIFITSLLSLFSSIAGDTSTLECDYCHPDDYSTLLKIKAGLNHPYIIINWEENGNCKDWCCISCDPKTHRVTTLVIGNDVIKPAARIPDAVGDLPDLGSLTLRKLVNLTGPIPRSITKLKKLTFLLLDYNNLTGPVPGFLSELPSLNYLRLSHNQLSGDIPARLSELPITGMFLDHNNLTGQIPAGLFRSANLTNDQLYVDLSHNQLTRIAPGFAEGLDFGTLSLGRNKLAGDASMLFRQKNVGTSIIDISRNSLEFDFSNVSISKQLTSLDISHNKIYGSLPKEIGKVQYFNASYNRLCGEIPSGFTDCSAFIHNKCLCGPPCSNNCKHALESELL